MVNGERKALWGGGGALRLPHPTQSVRVRNDEQKRMTKIAPSRLCGEIVFLAPLGVGVQSEEMLRNLSMTINWCNSCQN